MKARVSIDKERCKGCELCVEICRKAVLKMSKLLNSKGYHYVEVVAPDECNGCRECSQICPDTAVEIDMEDVKQRETKKELT